MATSRSNPGCSTQWYRQRRFERVVDVAGAVRREHDERRAGGGEPAELRDGDLVVGQHLQEVRLELVVGPVDLVDQQDRRGVAVVVDRLQQRPLEQEALVVQLVLQRVGAHAGGLAGGLGGAQVEQLAGVVPVVDGLAGVDALVALQADQLAAGPAGEHLGHLGLADPGLALQQQRSLQRDRQEDARRQPLVGQVAVGAERLGDFGGGARRDHRLQATALRRRAFVSRR